MSDTETTKVELGTHAYKRWLRAGRPQPIEWFLRLEELEQEGLAGMGDAYITDVFKGLAFRLGGVLEDEGQDSEPQEDEEAYVRRMAAGAISDVLGDRPRAIRPSVPPPNLVGITERKEAAAKKRKADEDGKRRFLGRAPDVVRNAEETAG